MEKATHTSPFVVSSLPPLATQSTYQGRPTTPIKAEVGADVIDLITLPCHPCVKQEEADIVPKVSLRMIH
jgi:hypothetical protein